jgi:hypothetical protein
MRQEFKTQLKPETDPDSNTSPAFVLGYHDRHYRPLRFGYRQFYFVGATLIFKQGMFHHTPSGPVAAVFTRR